MARLGVDSVRASPKLQLLWDGPGLQLLVSIRKEATVVTGGQGLVMHVGIGPCGSIQQMSSKC